MTDSDEPDKKLQGAFGDKGKKSNVNTFEHPDSVTILKHARDLMWPSLTGLSLWKVSELYNIPIKVFKGKGESTYVPEERCVIVYVPVNIKEATPKLVLDLCQALRLAEHDIIGFTAPKKEDDIFTYASVMHAKTIDSIMFMCKTVEELKGQPYYTILLDEVKTLGHGMVYKAYVEQASDEELGEAYAGRI